MDKVQSSISKRLSQFKVNGGKYQEDTPVDVRNNMKVFSVFFRKIPKSVQEASDKEDLKRHIKACIDLEQNTTIKVRKCLRERCSRLFLSIGKGNRNCEVCHKQDGSASDNSLDTYSFPYPEY